MINRIIEYKDKAYIVEEVKNGELKVKEYGYNKTTEKYEKVGKTKTIKDNYRLIPLQIVKMKYSFEETEETENEAAENTEKQEGEE